MPAHPGAFTEHLLCAAQVLCSEDSTRTGLDLCLVGPPVRPGLARLTAGLFLFGQSREVVDTPLLPLGSQVSWAHPPGAAHPGDSPCLL